MNSTELQSIKNRFGIVGNNPKLVDAISLAAQVAKTDLSVLVTGESGVGKENFPKLIHEMSTRRSRKYIAVNCGAIPGGTIDSELFGHVKGAFTGALNDRVGYFEAADGGTIFLDEVGDLPYPTQARLLRVLQSGEYMRVGSSEIRKTNVRVVAATNVNMMQAIRNGRFREDLYYRLNSVSISLPPLRERKEDIVPLFTKFASDFADKYNRQPVELTDDARQRIINYYWQGNIRQLKNVAEQISAIELDSLINADTLSRYLPEIPQNNMPQIVNFPSTDGNLASEREFMYQIIYELKKDIDVLKAQVAELSRDHGTGITKPVQSDKPALLPITAPAADFVEAQEYVEDEKEHNNQSTEPMRPQSINDLEKEAIINALKKHSGNRRCAAMELQLSERTLYRKIKDYGIEI